MAWTPFAALVRKDLQLFFTDRRAVMLSFVVPIVIASFLGAMFSNAAGDSGPAKISVAIVDQDGSAISKKIVSGVQADVHLRVASVDEPTARDDVRRGRTTVGVVIPPMNH